MFCFKMKVTIKLDKYNIINHYRSRQVKLAKQKLPQKKNMFIAAGYVCNLKYLILIDQQNI